ncbi:MAG: glycosyltransferase, partial [Streptosporangiaceae bacterium]
PPVAARTTCPCQAVLVQIAVVLAAVAALAWVYLLAGRGGFWRTDQRLPPGPAPAAWPAVAAVVPARDEAAILPQTLPTLLGQDYPGPHAVVLVDDDSSDPTAQIATGLRHPGSAAELRVVAGVPTPAGWAGKVWAMEQGLRAAGGAEYVLFTDADIAYAPGVLTDLVRAAESTRADLVSQMALLRADSFWERVLVPAFVYFFAQLYPFRRVNRGRAGAAAGGCMLVRRAALDAAGGLAQIRAARIDDVALGALLKGAGGRCWLGLSTQVRSLRPYPRLADVWDMVARSAYTQLRYSPAALAGTVLGLAWLYLLPPAAALAGLAVVLTGGSGWLLAAGLAGWALMSVTFMPMLALYRLPALRAPTLPLIAGLYAAMTVDSARRHRAGRGGEWKGRTITARAPRP